MSEEKVELKNCPFCGDVSHYIPARKVGQANLPAEIKCFTCGLTYIDGGKQKGKLVEWYNTRKIDALESTK